MYIRRMNSNGVAEKNRDANCVVEETRRGADCDGDETFLSIAVEELELSPRAFNAIKRANVNTIEDIENLTLGKLATIQNLGYPSAAEVFNVYLDTRRRMLAKNR